MQESYEGASGALRKKEKKRGLGPGKVAYAYNPSTSALRQEDYQEFEDSLDGIMSIRFARTT